ncbi:MAG TPA: molecular chaperone TorD family protein [Pyrinomonadaceae bacterium]|jgi:TorA maturation chaperone TorD|nr:molecular chaperone TorD family protein [Pyrinomonadaceae bacterium]
MELFRALAVLAEPPTVNGRRVAEALELGELPSGDEYTELFIFQLYPYASVYLGAEGMIGGEARDRVAGFWRALGQMPPAEPDHLSVMLALYARLVELETGESDAGRREGWRRARKAFLWEHLLSWLPAVYLTKFFSLATPFYNRWGVLLMSALLEEASLVGRQERLSLHLREATGLIDPRSEGGEDFLQSILTPVRSGMVLTRADLTRAARKLGLSVRMGERKFILKSLFAQDAHGVFDWLIEEATLWGEHHHNHRGALEEIGGAWGEKTKDTSALLEELRAGMMEG